MLVANSETLNLGPSQFESLLNDYCPELKAERFLLGSVFQFQNFKSKLVLGRVSKQDIATLESSLIRKLGLNQASAKWIADSWAVALEIETFAELELSFSCPNCDCPGEAERHWRGQFAKCPRCNATLRFPGSFQPVVHREGWPKRRLRRDMWMLSAHEDSKSILRESIQDLIADESLNSIQLAEEIGLHEIISVLLPETETVLEELNRNILFAGQEHLVKAILSGCFKPSSIHLQPHIPTERLRLLKSRFEKPPEAEEVLGMIDSAGSENISGIIFGSRSVFFSTDCGTSSLDYAAIGSMPILMEKSIDRFKIGDRRIVSVSGWGISRRVVIKALLTIAGCVRSARKHQGLVQQ